MHLTTEVLGPWHGEVRRAHQMLNAALIASVTDGPKNDVDNSVVG